MADKHLRMGDKKLFNEIQGPLGFVTLKLGTVKHNPSMDVISCSANPIRFTLSSALLPPELWPNDPQLVCREACS